MNEELTEALDILEDVLNQSCRDKDGDIDSCALSAYARGLRFLATRGRFRIDREFGRRVIGRWISED